MAMRHQQLLCAPQILSLVSLQMQATCRPKLPPGLLAIMLIQFADCAAYDWSSGQMQLRRAWPSARISDGAFCGLVPLEAQ